MQEERVREGKTWDHILPEREKEGIVAERWGDVKTVVVHELDYWHRDGAG